MPLVLSDHGRMQTYSYCTYVFSCNQTCYTFNRLMEIICCRLLHLETSIVGKNSPSYCSLNLLLTGSGSIFETLRLGKPLIVVVNEDLMDNHQSELADELAERNHLFCAHPQTLQETIEAMDLNVLQPYMPGDSKPVVALINKFLGFPVD